MSVADSLEATDGQSALTERAQLGAVIAIPQAVGTLAPRRVFGGHFGHFACAAGGARDPTLAPCWALRDWRPLGHFAYSCARRRHASE